MRVVAAFTLMLLIPVGTAQGLPGPPPEWLSMAPEAPTKDRVVRFGQNATPDDLPRPEPGTFASIAAYMSNYVDEHSWQAWLAIIELVVDVAHPASVWTDGPNCLDAANEQGANSLDEVGEEVYGALAQVLGEDPRERGLVCIGYGLAQDAAHDLTGEPVPSLVFCTT